MNDQVNGRRVKANATAFQRRGAVVESFERLFWLAHNRKSVYCTNAWGLLPAAALLNMPVKSVVRALYCNEIFEYNTHEHTRSN